MKTKNLATLSLAALAIYLIRKNVIRKSQKINFNNKVVLITGASRGLGLVLAKEFAKEGAKIAICGRDEFKLNAAKADLEKQGIEVIAMPCDITKDQELNSFINFVIRSYGKVDVLVNNAGTDIVGPLEETTLEDFKILMDLHFWAPLKASSRIVPLMKKRGGGRIINISSIGGKLTMPHMVAYNASKHALVGLSDGMRAELKKDNILVTTVCPGFLRTGTQHNVGFKGKNKKEFAWFSLVISNPITSMGSIKAAGKIVNACRYGDAELIMPLYAKVLSIIRNISPGFTSDLAVNVNHLLPGKGGVGTEKIIGAENYSSVSPSFFTMLSDKEAIRNNQF